jgi:hypothetical protein
MVEEEAFSPTFVEIGRCLFEQRVYGEFEF